MPPATATAPAVEAPTPAAELAVVPPAPQTITGRARDGWAEGNVALIRQTVAKDCNPAELSMFLELCARYQLDPFAKQIWAVKIKGSVVIVVSRDGLLAIANRQNDYTGIDGDVVRKKDAFKVIRHQGEIDVQHEYSGGAEDRGEIVGSWCMCYREGKKPTYFFANYKEYEGKNVWENQPSAMILKVAESMALRKAYSISGVVGEEEIEYKRATQNLSAAPDEPEWGEDALGAELKELVDRANEVTRKPEYRPRKVQTLLAGADDEAREKLRDELKTFITDHGGSDAAAEETVTDAEVVPDDSADKE